MLVQTQKEIDVNRLISELDNKANKIGDSKRPNGRLYEVTVNRQLLMDARDVLRAYYSKEIDDVK